MSKLEGFVMEDFLKNDFDNSNYALSILREKNYWVHFSILENYYTDFFRNDDKDLSGSHVKMALLHFLGGCSLNLVKGTARVMAGHSTDSSIYVRRTVESIRYAVYLREFPTMAEIWFNAEEKQEFEKKFRSWFHKSGKQIIEKEVPQSEYHFKHASNFGLHSNAELFSQQHFVTIKDKKMSFKVVFHEMELGTIGYHQLLIAYFWHLRIHFVTIDWWIKKSKFINQLNTEQIQFWSDCKTNFYRDDASMKKLVISGPLNTG
jgi:hypothetical protein